MHISDTWMLVALLCVHVRIRWLQACMGEETLWLHTVKTKCVILACVHVPFDCPLKLYQSIGVLVWHTCQK